MCALSRFLVLQYRPDGKSSAALRRRDGGGRPCFGRGLSALGDPRHDLLEAGDVFRPLDRERRGSSWPLRGRRGRLQGAEAGGSWEGTEVQIGAGAMGGSGGTR